MNKEEITAKLGASAQSLTAVNLIAIVESNIESYAFFARAKMVRKALKKI